MPQQQLTSSETRMKTYSSIPALCHSQPPRTGAAIAMSYICHRSRWPLTQSGPKPVACTPRGHRGDGQSVARAVSWDEGRPRTGLVHILTRAKFQSIEQDRLRARARAAGRGSSAQTPHRSGGVAGRTMIQLAGEYSPRHCWANHRADRAKGEIEWRSGSTSLPKAGDLLVRKAAASLFLSLAGAAEQPEDFVADVDDATEADLGGVSR
jgi:hypothetical protein